MQAPDWTEQGLCRGMDPKVFFPSDGVGVQEAVLICAECPVREPCLEYALANRIQHGIFGGVSERGRDRILRERRRAGRARAEAASEEPSRS